MTVFTEPRHPAEFLLSEGNGFISRDVVTLASNGSTAIAYKAGSVLALVTASSKYVYYDNAGTDGTETAKVILLEGCTVPATGDLKAAVIARAAEVKGSALEYDPSLSGGTLTTAQAAAAVDLAAYGIIVR
ncbi:head decoration protein [Roseomonas sp. HJA6]|uniref:Head decoration protein n=1 Tax=Roseomonas alba TaxID=2846776 RepID=A0ABS7ACF8_9PROT|nr:head decoration protein [Neoroseomonas alba]MBW6399988.1 head decoration protein [Neoroseomonas alba]